jgi:PIN domain nuclease of toxin-antitoxin system
VTLLDTQVLLWWLADDPRLGPGARALMAEGRLCVSTASLWEIAIKAGLGKLGADVGEVARAADASGMERLTLRDAHLEACQALPRRADHGDPFDRMLIAQALTEDLAILSADDKLGGYGADRIDAAR